MNCFLRPFGIVVVLLLASCYSPKHVGDGEMRDIRLATDLEAGLLHTSAGERFLFCETKGTPSGAVLTYRPDMSALRGGSRESDAFAVSPTEDIAVSAEGNLIVFLQVPDFKVLAEIPEPEGAFFDRETRIVALPDGAGFVFVTGKKNRPNLWMLSARERAFTGSGRSRLTGAVRGVAVDDLTGRLLLTTEGNSLEIIDLAAMRTVSMVRLPLVETSWGLAARAGVAWVGSRKGQLVPVNVRTGQAGEPFGLGGPGEVGLALSASGRFLAAAVQDRAGRRGPYPTNLRVFHVDEGHLLDNAKAFLETRGELMDLEVLDSTMTVAIATTWDLLAWKFPVR